LRSISARRLGQALDDHVHRAQEERVGNEHAAGEVLVQRALADLQSLGELGDADLHRCMRQNLARRVDHRHVSAYEIAHS